MTTAPGAIERRPGPMSLKRQVGDYFREKFLIIASGGFHTGTPLLAMSGTDRREIGRDTAWREFRLG